MTCMSGFSYLDQGQRSPEGRPSIPPERLVHVREALFGLQSRFDSMIGYRFQQRAGNRPMYAYSADANA